MDYNAAYIVMLPWKTLPRTILAFAADLYLLQIPVVAGVPTHRRGYFLVVLRRRLTCDRAVIFSDAVAVGWKRHRFTRLSRTRNNPTLFMRLLVS